MAKSPYDFYTPIDYTASYDKMAQARKDALDAAYNQQVNELNAQLPKIKETYDTQRNQTYRNARVTALGNNEGLAARGLAGNAYTAPVTGYSETSRIAETNALRSALNALNKQQQGQEDTIGTEIRQVGYDRDNALAQALAQIEQNRIAAQQSENQFGANYNLNAWQAQQNQEYQQQQLAYEKAMNELNLFGRIMTQEAANAIGLPVGTTLAKYNASGGSRSGGRGGNTSKQSYNFDGLIYNGTSNDQYNKSTTIQRIKDTYGATNAAFNAALNAAVSQGIINANDIAFYKKPDYTGKGR